MGLSHWAQSHVGRSLWAEGETGQPGGIAGGRRAEWLKGWKTQTLVSSQSRLAPAGHTAMLGVGTPHLSQLCMGLAQC